MQARLGSTRLPGKAFFTFFGQNMVERAISIAREIRGVERIVLATGDRAANRSLQPCVEAMGAEFFVGSEDNVLERVSAAIEGYEGEYLLRMTCDNYLIQPDVVEGLFEAACAADSDYAYVAPLSYFSGEIVRCDVLRACYEGDYSSEAAEHVTWDIRTDSTLSTTSLPDSFLELDHTAPLTLDTIEDLLIMKALERTLPSLRNPRCLEGAKQVARTYQNQTELLRQ